MKIRTQFILYGESQQRGRWEYTFDAISADLSRLDRVGPEEQVMVNNIKTSLARLKTIFAEVSSSIERNSQTPGSFFDQSFIQVSWSRMEVQTQAVVFDASRLFIMFDDRLDEARQMSTMLLLVLVGVFAVYIFSNYLVLFRRTLKSISELGVGARAIGAGNLDYSVPVRHQDEVGELSHAFNRMTSDLKKVTASKAELENEVEERKKAEQSVRESEAKYRRIVENANEGIWLIDKDNRTVFINRQGAKILGYEPEEMLGRSPAEFIPSGDVKKGAEDLESRQRGQSSHAEYRMHHKNGSEVWVYSNTVPIFESDGVYAGALAMFSDTTDRKKAEELVRFQARLVDSALEAIISANLTADGQLVTRTWNRGAEVLYGWLAEEVIGKPALHFLQPEFVLPGTFEEHWKQFAEQGRWVGEVVAKRKDGSKMVVLTSNTALRDNSGSITGVVGVHTDITDRKKAEAEIAYRATFPELNPNPIVELDTNGRILYMNPSARALFPELQKQEITHPYLIGWKALVSEFISTETGYRTRDIKVGDSWYEQVISHVPSSQNLRIYGRDITVRKKADELKDEFIGMVSHELKTPLTVIMGALATATDQRITAEQTRELLGDAVAHAGILANLVDNLLELSRQQSDRLVLNTQAVNVGHMVQNVLKNLHSKSNIHHLVSDVPLTLAPARADPLRVERILYNLIDNAIKYSPSGGEVRVAGRQSGDFMVIGVSDQGPGISSDDQARLFHSFERLGAIVKGAIQGTGLGLKVCRILVEAHIGRIWVESEKGKGSTFLFTLPVSRP